MTETCVQVPSGNDYIAKGAFSATVEEKRGKGRHRTVEEGYRERTAFASVACSIQISQHTNLTDCS